jgi:ABC-type amino acid transport substrate-binding protein
LVALRNDAVVIDVNVAYPMIKKLNIENDVVVSDLMFPKATHVAFSKNSTFAPLYEKGLKTIQVNGLYKKILDKWQLQ